MKPLKFFIAAIILSCASCVTSMQPLVTSKEIITDDRLAGTWVQKDTEFNIELFKTSMLKSKLDKVMKGKAKLVDTDLDDVKLKEKAYLLSYKKQKRTYFFLVSLISINEKLFADIYPFDLQDPANDEAGLGKENDFLTGYSIARLEIKDKTTISVDFLDGELIKKQVLAGNMRLSHEYDPLFGSFMITASSSELQQFIRKYGNDPRFFPSNNSITLTRKG